MKPESREIETVRYMEWERAKGSIRAVLASMWDMDQDEYEELDKLVENFVNKFGEKSGCD